MEKEEAQGTERITSPEKIFSLSTDISQFVRLAISFFPFDKFFRFSNTKGIKNYKSTWSFRS